MLSSTSHVLSFSKILQRITHAYPSDCKSNCIRGGNGAHEYFWAMVVLFQCCTVIYVCTTMYMFYKSVHEIERASDKYSARYILEQKKDRKRSKRFMLQGILYTAAAIFIWFFPLVFYIYYRITKGTHSLINTLIFVFNPLQGFFNVLIYLMPLYLKIRKECRKKKKAKLKEADNQNQKYNLLTTNRNISNKNQLPLKSVLRNSAIEKNKETKEFSCSAPNTINLTKKKSEEHSNYNLQRGEPKEKNEQASEVDGIEFVTGIEWISESEVHFSSDNFPSVYEFDDTSTEYHETFLDTELEERRFESSACNLEISSHLSNDGSDDGSTKYQEIFLESMTEKEMGNSNSIEGFLERNEHQGMNQRVNIVHSSDAKEIREVNQRNIAVSFSNFFTVVDYEEDSSFDDGSDFALDW